MKPLVRLAEALHGSLLVLGLGLPLVIFFARVRPWQQDVVVFFSQPAIHAAIANSLILALATSILSTGLAFIFSWTLWRFEWPAPLKRTVELLLKIPYLLPAFFFAIGWIALAAPTVGYLNVVALRLGLPVLPYIYGIGGAIFVETLWSIALAMIQLQGFFSQYPGSLEDAAIMCGASPAQAFLKVTLPLARPQLASCGLLTSVSALSAFGVPVLLASPARQFVLTTRIYQGIKSSQDFSQAALLSLALLAITLVVLVSQRFFHTASNRLVGGKPSRPAKLLPRAGAGLLFGGACLTAVISSVLPCAAIALQSLLRDPSNLASASLDRYAHVFGKSPDGLLALRNSLYTSLVAAGAATLLGLLVAYGAAKYRHKASRALIEAWNVGYALPGTVIALCLMVFYAGSITDTLWILILAYVVKYSSFSLRTLAPALGAMAPELEEAAWMCGASPGQAFFRMLVPMLSPALAAALLLALVPMLSELTMSVLLVGAGTENLGAMIYKFQEYADPGSAAVLAIVVMATILMLNALLKRLSKGSFGI